MTKIKNNPLTIVIPAFNEQQSLLSFLPEVINFCEKNKYNLILVNDGSNDDSKKVISKYLTKDFLTLINHKVNRGYGAAIKSGISAANTKYVITIDADGQHFLEDITKLHSKIMETEADLIIGSRVGQKAASIYRGIGKKIIYLIAKFLIQFNIKDLNSGMKIYDTELAQKYTQLCPDSMPFSDIIALVFINFRHLVLEEPIKIRKRIKGESTIGTMTAIETIKEILNIVVLFNPFKVFFFISILILGVSLVWGIPILLAGKGISGATLLGIITSLLIFLIGLIAEQISQLRKAKFKL